jgi:hypothetical protein
MKLIPIKTLIPLKRIADLRPIARAISLIALSAGLSGGLVPFSAAWASPFNGFDVSNAVVPLAEIRSGGPPRDGIPSIDKPKFIPASQATSLRPDDLVVSVTVEGRTRAYPLRILVHHEIVNDQIGTQAFAVTYCPLCGTAMVFDRRINGRMLTFGVSGLLYQSDVLMYDRQTESLWSQLAMKSVAGTQVDTELDWLVSEQLTFSAWRANYPAGRVLSPPIGSREDYSQWPYPGYEDSPHTMFPVPVRRTDLPTKSWVVGVIVNGIPKAYPVSVLPPNQTVTDEIGGVTIEITYDPQTRHAAVSDAVTGAGLPNVAVYWFAWQAFYPRTHLWQP